MEIAFSSSFKRAFRKRIKNNKLLEVNFWEKVEIFSQNCFAKELKTHKLSGKLKDLWSFSIGYDLRVIFYFTNDGKVVFIDIGSHKEVY